MTLLLSFSLLCCVGDGSESILSHELSVSAQRLEVLELQVELAGSKLQRELDRSGDTSVGVAMAAAQESDLAAKVRSERLRVSRLRAVAKQFSEAGPASLVFSVPGFESHPQLVAVSRLVLQCDPRHWKSSAFGSPSQRQGLSNSQVWREALQRMREPGEAEQARREIVVAEAEERLARLEQAGVWVTRKLVPKVRLTSGDNQSGELWLSADAIVDARMMQREYLLKLRPYRSQFAQWRVGAEDKRSAEFEWPRYDASEKAAVSPVDPGGQIRVWGSPTWAQLESATEAALLRFRSAEAGHIRATRSVARSDSTVSRSSGTQSDAMVDANACQVRLRKAEYRLTLALRDVYEDGSVENQRKLAERAMDVFRVHADTEALVRLGSMQHATCLEQVNQTQVRDDADYKAWKPRADALARLGRAESWLRATGRRRQVSQQKLDVLSRLAE